MLLCCTTHGHSRLQAGKHKCNPHPTSDSHQNSLRWLLLLAVDGKYILLDPEHQMKAPNETNRAAIAAAPSCFPAVHSAMECQARGRRSPSSLRHSALGRAGGAVPISGSNDPPIRRPIGWIGVILDRPTMITVTVLLMRKLGVFLQQARAAAALYDSVAFDVAVDAAHKDGATEVAERAGHDGEAQAEHERVAEVEACLEEARHLGLHEEVVHRVQEHVPVHPFKASSV